MLIFGRGIRHDWPDAELVQILKNLREAMSPSSKILFVRVSQFVVMLLTHSDRNVVTAVASAKCDPVIDYGVPGPVDLPPLDQTLGALDETEYSAIRLPAPLPQNGGEYARASESELSAGSDDKPDHLGFGPDRKRCSWTV
jgi:hypothetical protein